MPRPIPLPEPAWQPIETAPKDGTEILLFELLRGEESMIRAGYWEDQGESIHDVGEAAGWSIADSGYIGEIRPTHWMPLPAPPESGK